MSHGWLFNGNKISDRGCQHIGKGDWSQLKRVSLRILFNISEGGLWYSRGGVQVDW